MEKGKRKSGAEKLREKEIRKLAEDASKCVEITSMFAGTTVGAPAVPAAGSQHQQQVFKIRCDGPR
uniref:Uncharacterized protein n=1 Tax=Anguilla anguilla TaxID=7936 RepID=A0A0E9VMT5_ANGAN